jgi:RNA polymerase sigma factor (sigma-70 family)
MTDWDLVQDYVQCGSDEAFRRLVERHMGFVYQVCRREVCDQQVAEDASLAVFLLLARKAQTIRPGVQLTTWLFSAARLTARNAGREERRRKAREQRASEMAQYEEQGRSVVEREFVDTHLNDALAALSSSEREAVLLRYQDDLGVADVGKALGISESAAQMRLSRGLAKMRRIFTRRGSAMSAAALITALAAVKSQAAPAALVAQATAAGGATPAAALLYKGALKTMAMTKIKMATVVAAAVLLVGGGATFAIHRALASSQTPLSNNAFDYFNRAGDMVKGYNGDDSITMNTDPAADAALVAQNKKALNIVRAGFAFPYNPPEVHYDTTLPYLVEYRTLARMLVVEGKVRAHSGDLAGAASSDLDAIQLGETVPNRSVLIFSLIGYACNALGRRAIWANLQNLTAGQAEAVEQRLIAIDSRRVPFSQALQAEETSARTWPWTPEQASQRDSYLAYLGQWAQIVDTPYGVRPSLPAQPIATAPLTAEQKRALSNGENPLGTNATVAAIEMDNPGFSKVWYRSDLDEVRTEELVTALALQSYHVDKGTYPNSLQDLVPGYMPDLPRDLFDQNDTLRYSRTGSSYLLYSVGPDGVDNGGQATPGSGTDLNGKGDIVANVGGW